jgi:polysaccharide biosynthesis protein PslH
MKKILAIAPYSYLPYFSGGQKFIAKFFEYLSRETDLTVISVAENKVELAKTYKIIPLLKKSFSRYYDLSLVTKITSLVKKEKFDAIIWEHPYYAWLAKRIKKRTGVKTIIHTHNIEYQRFRSTGRWWWPILKIYEKRCLKRSDAVLFITPEDKDFAITKWKIEKEKCIIVPFGVDTEKYPGDKADCKKTICQKHHIQEEEKILLFNGLLNYKPNLDALKVILNEINPLLLRQISFRYKIIICGKGLPEELNSLKSYADKNIIYAGFVDDIDTYFKGADLFLNPVQSGGGIKTKMVEAIGYGTTVISTETGASGIDKAAAGNKLITVADNNWKEFADAIISNADISSQTQKNFYDIYYWGNIIQNAGWLF